MTIPEGLKEHYRKLQSEIYVSVTGAYTSLVTPNGNHLEPIHRWFHFKEAFSHRLLERVLKDEEPSRDRTLRLFDPFTGSGTTAVSAGQLVLSGSFRSAQFYGAECNPFLHLLASSKLAALQAPPKDFLSSARKIAGVARGHIRGKLQPPTLSTFRNEVYFTPEAVERLLRLRSAYDRLAGSMDHVTVLLAATCLAASVESASKLRRDGRTLRYAPTKTPLDPFDTFLRNAEKIQSDLSSRSATVRGGVVLADIRDGIGYPRSSVIDLALFSPPYPNNIDYTEVYKLELWTLGLITSDEEFAYQRRRTLRSHGSLRWADKYAYESGPHASAVDEMIGPIIDAIPPNNRYTNARRQLVTGYTDDMLGLVSRVHRVLRPGGLMACVVGNSLHGKPGEQFLVAADLIIARLCMLVGMEVTRIEVARKPMRRASCSDHLRESIIFARRLPGT